MVTIDGIEIKYVVSINLNLDIQRIEIKVWHDKRVNKKNNLTKLNKLQIEIQPPLPDEVGYAVISIPISSEIHFKTNGTA